MSTRALEQFSKKTLNESDDNTVPKLKKIEDLLDDVEQETEGIPNDFVQEAMTAVRKAIKYISDGEKGKNQPTYFPRVPAPRTKSR